MTPSLFECASGKKLSELDLASGWDSVDSARWALEQHWDTFINQSDFQYLASIGVNTVRLPIGYWNLGPSYCKDTPFDAFGDVYRNSWSRIIRAINMAAEVGISVLVDLHGAVGSQNGQPHSGISDGTTNLFKNPSNVEKTLNVLTYLVQQLVSVTNIAGIQVLNEPENVPELTDFCEPGFLLMTIPLILSTDSNAITAMRQTSPAAAQLPIYVHNGFDLQRFSDYVAGRTDFVVQDHHSYFVFTSSDDSEPASQHTGDIRGPVSDTLDGASKEQHRNIVVDEWSCALTPKSIANERDQRRAREDFCTGQMEVYTNTTAGWSFWCK
jgi:aryl-phospho-beta-D-glucosidase BglC (GH1 family)